MPVDFDPGLVTFAAVVFTLATLGYAATSTMLGHRIVASAARRTKSTLSHRSNVTLLAATRPMAFGASGSRGRQPMDPHAAETVPSAHGLSSSRQIERLAGYVGEQTARVANAETLHRNAGQQLDLASYSIQTLVRELADIVPSLKPTVVVRDTSPPAAQSGLSLAA